MLDLDKAKEIVEGTASATDLVELLEASVLVENIAAEVEKGRNSVFGGVVAMARNIFVEFREVDQKGGWNEAIPWEKAAATSFADEAARALAVGEARSYTKKQMNTFAQAIRVIKAAIKNGADLLEKDEAGNFVHATKTAMERFNKECNQKQEEAEDAEARAATKAAGSIRLLPDDSEVPETGSVLDLIQSDSLRSLMEDYIQEIASLEEYDESQAEQALRRGIGAVQKNIKNSLENLKKAANA